MPSENDKGGIGRVLAVIPARGGSKGVPRKNLRELHGKPLIAWSIEAALGASSIDRVVVSTEDEEIASVSRGLGAGVPVMRPAELSLDGTHGVEPVIHMIGWLRDEEGYLPDTVMLLQPTSPLRTTSDIEGFCAWMSSGGYVSALSVREVSEPPAWMKTMDPDGRLRPCIGEGSVNLPRQELESLFIPNGAIYASATSLLLEARSFYTEETRGYLMPLERSVDIDTEFDLAVAGCMLARGL